MARLILTAVVACVLTFGARLGPPGSMMFVLVTGVTDQLATPASHGGSGVERWDIPPLIAIGGLGACAAV